MRRKILFISVVAIIISITTTGTWAYFTASKTVTNVITMGTIDVEIVEKMVDSNGDIVDFEDQTGVVAGEAVSKIVTVENTGIGEAWARVQVIKEVTAPDGTDLDASIMDFTLGADWIDGGDGYYYYNASLAQGEVTSALWEEIIFDTSMGNEYQGATSTIDVSVYAVQFANNPIPDGGDVTDVLGWPT